MPSSGQFPPPFAVELAQQWLQGDLYRALGNFTWINNLTLGAAYCRFAAQAPDHCLALHTGLPFIGISVEGHHVATIRRLAGQLLASGQEAYTLATERITRPMAEAVEILEVRPEWQMLFTGDGSRLPATSAIRLHEMDLAEMNSLAASDDMMVFSPELLARGEFFGIFEGEALVAMAGVQNRLPGLVEIGSIVTHPQYRRRGYATQVITALLHQLLGRGEQVFLCLFQTNQPALVLYQRLGFEIVHELELVRWRLSP